MLQRDLDRGDFDAIIINFYNPPKPSLYPKVFQVSLGVAQLIPKQKRFGSLSNYRVKLTV